MRLNEKLDKVDGLRNKFDCFTIDSFAWRVCFRFRYRLREAGARALNASDFDHTCELAAMLLKDRSVSSWVSAVYPYILVDEAQDLKAQRLAIVEGLATTSRVFLAFDEFQCLNKENRPVAIVSWASGVCVPKTLIQNQRTKDQDLIRTANEIRSGQAITVNSSSFRVTDAPSRPGSEPRYAATLAAAEILRRKDGTTAIIVPTVKGFASNVLRLLQTEQLGAKKLGPFRIEWERGITDVREDLLVRLRSQTTYDFPEVSKLLDELGESPAVELTKKWVKRCKAAKGWTVFPSEALINQLNKSFDAIRQHSRKGARRLNAMTIHQAKNREFDHVIVLWPFTIGGDADQRRRLLYNAVTRARHSCLIILQSAKLKESPPFAASVLVQRTS